MSVDAPVYSSNPVLSGIEHVGHWLHKGEEIVVDELPKFIKVKDEVEQQAPDVVAKVQAVVGDVVSLKSLVAAVVLAAAAKGTNVSADAGVLAALEAAVPTFQKIAADVQTLTDTVTADFKQDAADLA